MAVPRGISRVVSIMYEDARNAGLVENNPFSRLRLPATGRKGRIVPPTLDEYRAVLEACTILGGYGREFRAIVEFAAWTGVRAGELHALRWEDVGDEVVHVRHSRARDGTVGLPKSGKARTIAYLPPARLPDDHPRRPDGFVFHGPRGKPLVQGSHHYAWRAVRAAAGLPKARWHDWRHFCATQLLDVGMTHSDVAQQLGHEDGGTLVRERYGHPDEGMARQRLLAAFTPDAAKIGSSTGSTAAAGPHGNGP